VVVVTRRDSADAGFSLVEALAALLILSLVALSVLALLTRSMQLNATGRDYNTLVNLARNKLEELVAVPYGDPDLTPGVSHSDAPGPLGMTRTWTVEEYSINQATPDPATAMLTPVSPGNIKLVTVSLRTRQGSGIGERSVTVEALKRAD
jgi:Tfp pilus assembly protein PilV